MIIIIILNVIFSIFTKSQKIMYFYTSIVTIVAAINSDEDSLNIYV